MNHRKVPYSGKKKKAQLKAKRARKAQGGADNPEEPATTEETQQPSTTQQPKAKKTNSSNSGATTTKAKENKLTTVFARESNSEVDKRKYDSMKPLNRSKEWGGASYYTGSLIDIPVRPHWDYTLSKEELEKNEKQYFSQYLSDIYEKYSRDRLNFFEHNLEVWRQLWRVCEISDILLVLTDVRHPLFHFPPSLFDYVHKILKKPMILVLTKTDLVPKENVELWTAYLQQKFVGLEVTYVQPYFRDRKIPGRLAKKREKKLSGNNQLIQILNKYILQKGGKPLQEIEITEEDEQQETELTEEKETLALPKRPIDLNEQKYAPSRRQRRTLDFMEPVVKDNSDSDSHGDNLSDDDLPKDDAEEEIEAEEDENQQQQSEQDVPPNVNSQSLVTVGLIGHPNVGKSTLVNSLKGQKVCSVSRTPGHTKYKQTIFLNDYCMLADSPGLVFPAVGVPKELQILCGLFPLAQVREPFSPIRYLAERVPLEKIYRLKKLYEDQPWSAYEICESYAEKRGYRTKTGRSDCHRAGLELLRHYCDGVIVFYALPNTTRVNWRLYGKAQEENPDKGNEQQSDEDQSDEDHEQNTSHHTKHTHKIQKGTEKNLPNHANNKTSNNQPKPQSSRPNSFALLSHENPDEDDQNDDHSDDTED